jgi:hypothetical protein
LAGTAITLTGTATGGANLVYQFNAGATILQAYAAGNTFAWNPTAGTYSLTVSVKDLNGANPATVVTSTAANYVIAAPLTKVTMAGAPVSPVTVNTPLTLTATATGGATVQYRFIVSVNGATSTQIQAYGSSATCNYTPTVAGNYTFVVFAKDLLTPAAPYLSATLKYKVN